MEKGSKIITSSQNSENFAHFSSQSGNINKFTKWKDKNGGRLYCDHCNRSGHSKDRCWVLYPHLKPTQNRPKQANVVSHSDSGDVQSKLEQLSKQMEFLMKNCATGGESSHNSSSGEASNIVQRTGNLIALSSSYSKIIVNSGATDNMFTSSELLTKFQPESTYPHVTVANGLVIPTKGSGTTSVFSRDIDVTVVPDLKTNLLSISKCTNQMDCNVIFTPQKVVFQDRTSGKKIGEGNLIDRLYVIKPEQLALTAAREISSPFY
jgi:hypothetical protein